MATTSNAIPWGPVRSTLTEKFSFGDIKQIVGYGDLDMSRLAHLEQKPQNGASKSQILSEIDKQVGAMDEKRQFLSWRLTWSRNCLFRR